MFALKLSSVILSENTDFSSLCFNKGAAEAGESGCRLFVCCSCAELPLVLLTMHIGVSYLFVMTA